MQQIFRNKIVQNIIVMLLITIVVITLLQMYRGAYRVNGYDFTCYVNAAKALWNGENPYILQSEFPFIYPLFFALIMYPLAVLPYWMANLIWFLLNLIALIAIVKMTLTWIQKFLPENSSDYIVLIFVVVISSFSVIQNHLLNGQVNILLLFLCLLFFKLQQDNKSMASALVLSLAILIKLVPALFLLWLLLRKRYQTLMMTFIFLTLGLLLPYILVGDQLLSFYSVYVKDFILPGLSGTREAHQAGLFFTIKGCVSYLMPIYGKHIIVTVLSVLLPLMFIIKAEIDNKKSRMPLAQFHIFGLYLLGLLLLSPMSETHHLIFLFPIFLLIVFELIFIPALRDYRSIAGIILFFIFFAMIGKIWKTGPGYFCCIITLFILNLIMLQRLRVSTDVCKAPSINNSLTKDQTACE